MLASRSQRSSKARGSVLLCRAGHHVCLNAHRSLILTGALGAGGIADGLRAPKARQRAFPQNASRTCHFARGGLYRGCLSSYSCRICRMWWRRAVRGDAAVLGYAPGLPGDALQLGLKGPERRIAPPQATAASGSATRLRCARGSLRDHQRLE